MNEYYRFLKGFYGPADIPTIFQETIDRTLGHQTPVWLEDVIIVIWGTKEEQPRKLYSVLRKLENEGYKARKINQQFTKKKQYGSDKQSHRMESDPKRKKQTQLEPHMR